MAVEYSSLVKMLLARHRFSIGSSWHIGRVLLVVLFEVARGRASTSTGSPNTTRTAGRPTTRPVNIHRRTFSVAFGAIYGYYIQALERQQFGEKVHIRFEEARRGTWDLEFLHFDTPARFGIYVIGRILVQWSGLV